MNRFKCFHLLITTECFLFVLKIQMLTHNAIFLVKLTMYQYTYYSQQMYKATKSQFKVKLFWVEGNTQKKKNIPE